MKLRYDAKKALMIGAICAVAYCTVYISRDILGTLTPVLIKKGIFTQGQMGTFAFIFPITYAIGQLINGIIGDKINGKYMVSLGLILAGICLSALPAITETPWLAYSVYGAMGFFLSMVYAPMTKLIAENNDPVMTTRCNVAHSMASYVGAPIAGLLAAWLAWQKAFVISSGLVIAMGVLFFLGFTWFEKKDMVRYGQFPKQKGAAGSIGVLLKRQILKWALIAMLTGVVRTAILAWLTTYIVQRLGRTETSASLMYTVGTGFLAINSVLSVIIHSWLKRNTNKALLVFFSVSAVSFLGAYFITQAYVNLALMIVAMIFSNCASSIMWNTYCPSLRDTGMVSSATGFLDFCSYLAAGISGKLFAGAGSTISWDALVLVWCGLMVLGMGTALIKEKTPVTAKENS
jgi:sugar phosphate permease